MIEHSDTQYARSGDLSIAYRTVGEGEPDILFIPGFISNVEVIPDIPWLAHVLQRFATMGRVVYFDKRGMGLSDRTLGPGSAEERMDDLRAVVDAAGIDRATIVGISEGGPLALLYTAAHPERVRSLVLWGTMARLRWAPDYPDGVDAEPVEDLLRHVEELWGTGHALRAFIRLPRDDATLRVVARYERLAATPRDAVALLRHNVEIDVRAVLGSVRVPTLVVHRAGDRLVPTPLGRYLADHIPGARYVERPGSWHVSGTVGDEDDLVDVVEEFVTGGPAAPESDVDRVLSTVLFTDIVDSTRRAAEMGDRRWRAVLEQHDAIARREVERQRGVIVKQTGDGLLATFDGPGRAVRAALGIRDAVAPLGLEVRAGVHTGEIERRGADVAGIAVHIGARLGAGARAGEVLASGTVKDLVVGSGLTFDDRGTVELKGVPGEWRVYAATA